MLPFIFSSHISAHPLQRAQLPNDIKWHDLSLNTQKKLIKRDNIISHTVSQLLKLSDDVDANSQELNEFRERHKFIRFILHTKDHPDFANVPHIAFASEGRITGFSPSMTINIYNFNEKEINTSPLTKHQRRLGYRALLQKGNKGVRDIIIHEIGHLFNHTDHKGVKVKTFIREEEKRADHFLINIRKRLLKLKNNKLLPGGVGYLVSSTIAL
ncbi:hypothetical protein [Parashewanella tropica]|uniref:hypothetical protein n=1 Tax=Parashewanella tropica TaxID=2547970 RepID=UPI00105A8A30|nr:hypothetical protein [Parashewanella tropica]